MANAAVRRLATVALVLLGISAGGFLLYCAARQDEGPAPPVREGPPGPRPEARAKEKEVFAGVRRTHRGGTGLSCELSDGRQIRAREGMLEGSGVPGATTTLVSALLLGDEIIWKRQLNLTKGAEALFEEDIRMALSVRAMTACEGTVWIVATAGHEVTGEALRISGDDVETFQRGVLTLEPPYWGRSRFGIESSTVVADQETAKVKVVVGHGDGGVEQGVNAECCIKGDAVVVTRVENYPQQRRPRR